MEKIYSDINVRITEVDSTDNMVIYDTPSVKQSLFRLVKTKEQEVYNFRAYGLNLEQFLHYPINVNTGNLAYKHVEDKINRFENRVLIRDDLSVINIDYDMEYISLDVAVQVRDTGEVIYLPTLEVINNTI